MLKPITDAVLGAEPPAAGGYERLGANPQPLGDFCGFFEKKAIFDPTGSHFARVHSHLKGLGVKHLKTNRKNLIVQSSFYLQLKSKTRLKSCIIV